MLIALKLLACTIIASFGISVSAQNEFAEKTSAAVFAFSSIITAVLALSL